MFVRTTARLFSNAVSARLDYRSDRYGMPSTSLAGQSGGKPADIRAEARSQVRVSVHFRTPRPLFDYHSRRAREEQIAAINAVSEPAAVAHHALSRDHASEAVVALIGRAPRLVDRRG